MSRILIVSALRQELSDIDDVLYTGVGKVNATYKLTELLTRVYGKDRFDLVINYGTAASKTYSGLVDCTKFIQRDMDATPMGFNIGETPFDNEPSMIDFSHIKNPIGKNLCCYTGDSFATDLTPYDDVVATGGTAKGSIEVLKKAGYTPTSALFLVELDFLNPKLDVPHKSVIHYE